MQNLSNSRNSRPSTTNPTDLRNWVVFTRLPQLVKKLNLIAGVILAIIDVGVRRALYGLNSEDTLPTCIDWSRNGIIISAPGTGKGVAAFPAALEKFKKVFVIVPSVVQASKLEQSLDELYSPEVGGCWSSEKQNTGLINIITTGIFHLLVRDTNSDLWKKDTVLFVDEAQRIYDEDPETEFLIGYMAALGLPTYIVSATIDPGNLSQVLGHEGNPAVVYELNKQMHPVDVSVVNQDWENTIKTLPELNIPRHTSLIFCSTRRSVYATCELIKKETRAMTIPVTGAHMMEDQLRKIEHAQMSGRPIAVVATPGTMDSSVTIKGLSLVVVEDKKIQIDFNQFGIRERRVVNMSINHLWQIVRRVGRLARTDGKKDRVLVVSDSGRTDVLQPSPSFQPLSGCSAYTPIEKVLLEAVRLDVPFSHISDYMVSKFSQTHIEATITRLLADGMITRTDNPSDPDGFGLTELGRQTVSLPFDYEWSKLIVNAIKAMQPYLAIAASFGRLEDLKSFGDSESENEQEQLKGHPQSEILRKIKLGVEYLNLQHDHLQNGHAKRFCMSFKRLEQMEKLWEIAAEVLELTIPENCGWETEEYLLRYLIRAGHKSGLFGLYLCSKGRNGGWSQLKQDVSGELRRFFLDQDGLDFSAYDSEGSIIPVAAEATWFEAKNGKASANLDNVSIIPSDILPEILSAEASKNGWMKLSFTESEFRGEKQMECKEGRNTYIPARINSIAVQVGKSYWCSVDREICRGKSTVLIHCLAE